MLQDQNLHDQEMMRSSLKSEHGDKLETVLRQEHLEQEARQQEQIKFIELMYSEKIEQLHEEQAAHRQTSLQKQDECADNSDKTMRKERKALATEFEANLEDRIQIVNLEHTENLKR